MPQNLTSQFEFLLCWQSGLMEAHTCLAISTLRGVQENSLQLLSGPHLVSFLPRKNIPFVFLAIVCLLHQRRVLFILVSAGCSLGA